MTTNWNGYENSCANYLNSKYGKHGYRFVQTGRSNSTCSDIVVYCGSRPVFYIESKMPVAQAGQFVVINDGYSFRNGERNRAELNSYALDIIKAINREYGNYQSVTTSSIPINVDQNTLANWIVGHYKSLNVKFIITGEPPNYIIFPIQRFSYYFRIEANLRKKGSGSRDLTQSRKDIFMGLFRRKCGDGTLFKVSSSYYVESNCRNIDRLEISDGDYRYYLTSEGGSRYKVRMLSNTSNPTVIMSVYLKRDQSLSDLGDFENLLISPNC